MAAQRATKDVLNKQAALAATSKVAGRRIAVVDCLARSHSDTTILVPNGVCSFLTAAWLIGMVSRALRGVEVCAVVEE